MDGLLSPRLEARQKCAPNANEFALSANQKFLQCFTIAKPMGHDVMFCPVISISLPKDDFSSLPKVIHHMELNIE
jgi:hypothetical protein